MRRTRWWAACGAATALAVASLGPGATPTPAVSGAARRAVAATPQGLLDQVRVTPDGVELTGWLAGDAVDSPIHVRVGDRTITTTVADQLRPDLAVVDPDARAFRVTWTYPSSEPTHITFGSCGDGAMAKTVAYVSTPVWSRVIGPPDGPTVIGSFRVRSGLIWTQFCPSVVVFQTFCVPV